MSIIRVSPLPGDEQNMVTLYQGLLTTVAAKLTEAGLPAEVAAPSHYIQVDSGDTNAILRVLLAMPETQEVAPPVDGVINLYVFAYRLHPRGGKKERTDLLVWVAEHIGSVRSAELIEDAKLLIEFVDGSRITLTVSDVVRH